ncbi:MAG: isoprenylcysteine carboxylmethyltransferase family protein [Candidatus Omnitrophica bacterium]|nr:isoprenylcysteine carboxylmethyltransferase family protein [Candidatus Omnitrophota bacterium]
MKRRIKIQGFLIFLAVAISILLSKFLFPQWKHEAADEFLDALGISIVFFGFLFRIAARGYKAEKSADGSLLIKDGPYGLMRNPMYFGTFLIGVGIVLVLFKWWVFLLFLLVFLLIYSAQINKEENKLSQQFGDEYLVYSKDVPKYFPNIFRLLKMDLGDYLFFKWSWIKKELISLLVVIAVIIAAETWEDVQLFGYQEYWKELLELFLIIVFFVIIFILLYEREGLSRKK